VGSGNQDAKLDEIVSRLTAADVPVERVDAQVLDGLSSHGAHQGVVVEAAPFSYADIADVISRAGTGDALVVVLDHVTDEGNFGAIVRSAEVVGAAGVVIPNVRSAAVGTAAYKTSAGAVLHIPIARVPNLAAAVLQLQEAGFWVGAATEHADDVAWDAPLSGRVAIVMGSEGSGVSRLVLDRCDFSCRLPQLGRVESLNVAQATTVLCYEWMRRTHPEAGRAQGDD
jgi:23S rRNA (guanosine2251-2'-O)-methyltransferase